MRAIAPWILGSVAGAVIIGAIAIAAHEFSNPDDSRSVPRKNGSSGLVIPSKPPMRVVTGELAKIAAARPGIPRIAWRPVELGLSQADLPGNTSPQAIVAP